MGKGMGNAKYTRRLPMHITNESGSLVMKHLRGGQIGRKEKLPK
jgi:hypothetical protein